MANQKREEALVKRLTSASQGLADLGWSKTRIYEVMRDSIKSSKHQTKIRESHMRDIAIFAALLEDASIEKVKSDFQLSSLNHKQAMIIGERKTRKVLHLSTRDEPLLFSHKPSEEQRQFWIKRANEALDKLREDSEAA
jgi:hypothetical protein